jgi:hypothetical protein
VERDQILSGLHVTFDFDTSISQLISRTDFCLSIFLILPRSVATSPITDTTQHLAPRPENQTVKPFNQFALRPSRLSPCPRNPSPTCTAPSSASSAWP